MKTYEKREHFIKNNSCAFHQLNTSIENKEYRVIDRYAQKCDDIINLQYLMTLLCDELVKLTNENNTGE